MQPRTFPIAACGAALAVLGTCSVGSSAVAAPGASGAQRIVVSTTIQAAVDAASPGDTVVIPAGTYEESVVVTTPRLTLVGARGAVLDGSAMAARVGIRVRPPSGIPQLDGFTLQGLTVRGYEFAGVQLSGVTNFRLTGGTYEDNEEYGVFPVRSTHGRVDHLTVTGSEDSGIYVGQASDVRVDHNVVHDNTNGIEIELCRDVTVSDNVATDNALGLVVQVVPGRPGKVTDGIRVERNVFAGNNRANPNVDPGDILSLLPGGVGVLDIGGDGLELAGNVITGNRSLGVGVAQLPPPLAALDPLVDPWPDRVRVERNVVTGNAFSPDPRLAPFPARDLIWDATGSENCFSVAPATSTFPAALPACSP